MADLRAALKERLGMDFDAALREIGLSPPAFERVLKVSVLSTEPTLKVLDAAILSGDMAAIMSGAHELKGVFMNLRLDVLAGPARQIEALATAGAPRSSFCGPLADFRAQFLILKEII